MTLTREQYSWALVRIALGFTFFWAFIDKLFGLGFATKPAAAWLAGGSPTTGFLSKAVHGPFATIFQSLAGQGWVDVLFMTGLLLIGLALLLGMGVQIAGYTGTLLVLLMYLSLIPPANNPILDEHIIYAIILMGMTKVPAGDWIGLGKWWKNTSLVEKYPILA